MQRFFEHRATFDRIKRLALFQTTMKLFHQRALAGSHRTHEIEDLTALLAFERGGVQIANNLRNSFLDTEKLVGKEIVELYGFVLIEPLNVRIMIFVDVTRADFDDGVVETRMGELGNERIGLHLLQITEQISFPGPGLMHIPV